MCRSLRFAFFLAPNMLAVYAHTVRALEARLGVRIELFIGSCYEQVTAQADFGCICGLAYIELERKGANLEPLVAPVLEGSRYAGRPVYWSEVVVHRNSPFQSFADLRGRTWSYNEPLSHSGYGITRHKLLEMGETHGFFGAVIEAGFHERSLRMVASGEVDATAVDCQVLAIAAREQPELVSRLRVIESFGPSTIQPVVALRALPSKLRSELRTALLEIGEAPASRPHLSRGLVERFVPVDDASYDDLRVMRDACERADFLTLR